MDNIVQAGTFPPPDPARAWSDLPTLTLGALVQAAGSAIRKALPSELWLEAQVVAARRQDWGWVLELVDGQAANTATAARLTCMASTRTITGISEELEIEFDPTVLVGTCALLRVRPRFHVRHQLGATLTGVNPAFGAGLLTLQIERLRQALRQEGIIDRQHRLGRPTDVMAIAVIAPEHSAGLADVTQELERWALAGIMDVYWIDATFEGPKASMSLATAITYAGKLAEERKIDLLLIVRGGGARAGVAAASSEAAVRAVLSVPVPVVTGIGHATDVNLLDEIAWHSAHTPSKAIAAVQRLFAQPAAQAEHAWKAITSALHDSLRHRFTPELERQRDFLAFHAKNLALAEIGAVEGLRTVVEFHRAGAVVHVRQLRHALDDQAAAIAWLSTDRPAVERDRVDDLYARILDRGRDLLRGFDDLSDRASDTESHLIGLMARQITELKLMSHIAEQGMQRAYALAVADLATAYAAVQALDVDALLARGLVLAVRDDGTWLKSAVDAGAEPKFKLLFGDGVVAVSPETSPEIATLH